MRQLTAKDGELKRFKAKMKVLNVNDSQDEELSQGLKELEEWAASKKAQLTKLLKSDKKAPGQRAELLISGDEDFEILKPCDLPNTREMLDTPIERGGKGRTRTLKRKLKRKSKTQSSMGAVAKEGQSRRLRLK